VTPIHIIEPEKGSRVGKTTNTKRFRPTECNVSSRSVWNKLYRK